MFDIKFKLRDCIVSVSFPFLALLTALLLLNNNLALFNGILAAIVHEFGHIFAMALKKSKPTQIYLRAFSVDIIDPKKELRDYNTDIFILLAGPLANLILSVVLFLLHSCFTISRLLVFAYANLFLAFFNLLPIEPLDGGQIIFNLLLRTLEVKTSRKLILFISFLVLFPLAILGFYTLLHSKNNFSLLFLSCYLMTVLLFKNCRYDSYFLSN